MVYFYFVVGFDYLWVASFILFSPPSLRLGSTLIVSGGFIISIGFYRVTCVLVLPYGGNSNVFVGAFFILSHVTRHPPTGRSMMGGGRTPFAHQSTKSIHGHATITYHFLEHRRIIFLLRTFLFEGGGDFYVSF